MKKLIGIILLSLALTGCGQFNPFSAITNPITANRLAAIESSYGIALSAAVAYRSQRLCKKDEIATIENICAYRSVILQLQAADLKAQAALRVARNYTKDPTINAFDALNAAQTAVSVFQQLQVQYGVR